MVTGLGFLMASVAKDLLSVVGWSIPAIIVLSVPPFGVLFPGTVTAWAKLIPSHYLADTLHKAANFGASWADLWPNLLILLAFDAVVLWLGATVLKNKLR